MANKEERAAHVARFLFHLGRGIWKSLPVDPIIDEIVYAQYENELKPYLSSLTDQDLALIEQRLAHLDTESLDKQLTGLQGTLEVQMDYVNALCHHLEQISRLVGANNKTLDLIAKQTDLLPNIQQIVDQIASNLGDHIALKDALETISRRRQAWTLRISNNQIRLLKAIDSDHYQIISDIWTGMTDLIPECTPFPIPRTRMAGVDRAVLTKMDGTTSALWMGQIFSR